jgi:hypothetical protein
MKKHEVYTEMRWIGFGLLVTGLVTIGFPPEAFSRQPIQQETPARPRQARPSEKPPAAEPVEKADPKSQDSDEAMRQALTNLSTQIGLLTDELRMMRRETERNSGTMELLLNEDRLTKLEDKIQDAVDHKAQLDGREQEIGRRLRNISGEVVLRGGLRRDETEAAIRNELQRALEDVRSQQSIYQQRIAELNEQASRLRARVETLRKKLETPEPKTEKQEK